jgi:hypothetical protein
MEETPMEETPIASVQTAPANGAPTGAPMSYKQKMAKHDRLLRFLTDPESAERASAMTDEAVAAICDVTPGTVARQRRQIAGGRIAPQEGKRARLPGGEAWRLMQEAGTRWPGRQWTVREISEETGLGDQVVRNQLEAHGLPVERPQGLPAYKGGTVRLPAGDDAHELRLTPREVSQVDAALDGEMAPGEQRRITFLGYTSDGTPIGRPAGTDLLWALKLDRPL